MSTRYATYTRRELILRRSSTKIFAKRKGLEQIQGIIKAIIYIYIPIFLHLKLEKQMRVYLSSTFVLRASEKEIHLYSAGNIAL